LSQRGRRPAVSRLRSELPVAVDAMGGDRAPDEIVAGARRAADEGVPVLLVGPPDILGDPLGLEVVACTEVIVMDEDAGQAVRRKKDSSLVRAAELVRDGLASAMVSAGNTGATMASAMLRMGRLPRVLRPCIATPLPRLGSQPAVLVDAGANAECTPAMLVQFARMGASYVAARFGVDQPKVGLLSIGEEATKGTPLVKDTHQLLAALDAQGAIRFNGNVEGRDLMGSLVDVVVTDGFTGNVALKAMEGAARLIADAMREEFGRTGLRKLGYLAARPALSALRTRIDPRRYNGASMIGLNGIVIKSHGGTDQFGFQRAIEVAVLEARNGVPAQITQRLQAPRGA
jgi:phosphate acyltransferase